MKVTPCNYVKYGNYEHMNQCTCGIAARASSDVYVIDRCPGTVPFYFGFKSCVEDILNVMKKANDEHDYEVIKISYFNLYELKAHMQLVKHSTYY